jgi:cytochrome c biogenesis protein CcmG, thiol:disulfide interchange protein DsbE
VRAARPVLAIVMAGAIGACAATGTGGAGSQAGGGSRAETRGQGVGHAAPEIVVDQVKGGSLSLSSLRGRVVLLDVWASWCGPCKQELPMLDAIAGRLRRRGVEVLAVSVDQDRENVDKFLGARSHWNLTVAHDPKGAIADTFQPEKMPTSYVIDREGIIRYVNSGFEPGDAKEIEQRLAELAGEGADPDATAGSGGAKPRLRRH